MKLADVMPRAFFTSTEMVDDRVYTMVAYREDYSSHFVAFNERGNRSCTLGDANLTLDLEAMEQVIRELAEDPDNLVILMNSIPDNTTYRRVSADYAKTSLYPHAVKRMATLHRVALQALQNASGSPESDDDTTTGGV